MYCVIMAAFCVGANMNFLTLVKRGVRVLSRDPAMVASPNIQLVFNHRGGAMLSVALPAV